MATDLNYLKRAILTLALSADERDAPDLGARFYSYDKQSGKFIVRLIDEEDQPIDLSQFAIINMVMAPNRDISKGRTIVPMQTEDPEDGVVSVVLPDNIRQFNGTIIAGVVAMNADNIKTHDFGYFRFEMQQSLIDADIENLSDFYVDEFEQLREQIHQIMQDTLDDIDAFKLNINAQLQELQNKINAARVDLDKLTAAINAAKINTRNVFDSSLILMPENNTRRRVDGNTIDLRGWGAILIQNANVISMFEPNKTYHTKYVAELLTLTGGTVTQGGQFGLAFYSGKPDYPTVWLTQIVVPNDMQNMKVGDTIVMEQTFTTPAELHNTDANYQILQYSRRDSAGVIDAVRLHDIMIQEGTIYTGIQTNPDNTLTRFDEERLVKSILIDPKMTGTNPPTIEGGTGTPTTSVTYSSTGEMRIQNLSTAGRARVYWTATQLGLDFAISKQPFNVKMVARVTSNGSQVEVGYSGQTGNPIFNITAQMDTYTATIKAEVNTAFCIYLEQGETLVIRELYIYPANTDITSKRIATIEEGLPEVKTMVTGTPDTLQNPNANTLTTSGRWKVYTGTNMPPLPISSGSYYWYFEVINFNPDNCLQRASLRYSGNPSTSNGNFEYTRQLVNGSWGTWQRFDLETVEGNNLSKTGANLNDEVVGGRYIYINPTSAPKSGTFYGEIIRYGGAYVMQRLTNVNATDETFQRVMINTAWQPWRKYDIVPATGNTNQLQAADFNTVLSSGNYINVSAMLNCPNDETGSSWYLEVIKYSDTYLYQRVTKVAASNATYDRQYLNGIWQPWRAVLDSNNNQTVGGLKNFTTRPTVNGAQVATNVEPTPLTGTVNWDSFDQPGRWYMSGIANGPKYLSNYGYLEVTSHPNSVAAIQTYTDIYDNCIMRTRKSIGGVPTWGTWKVIRLSLPEANLSYLAGWDDYNTDTSSWQHAKAVRDGDTVTLAGTIRNTTTFTPTNGQELMATIPEGYRPKYNRNGNIMRSSGRTMYTCDIYTDGRLTNSTMVDPGVNGYAGEQAPGKIFHISVTYVGEDLVFF